MHSLPVDVADHFLGLGLVDAALRAALVDERQVGTEIAEVFGHARRDLDATGIGGDDDGLVGMLAHVVLEHRGGRQVIDRALEEPLDLAAVQVDRHHPLRAGGLEQVGDESGGDRLAALGLVILAGISVERAHRGDPLRRGPVRRVDHDQLLHDRVVDAVLVDRRSGSA